MGLLFLPACVLVNGSDCEQSNRSVPTPQHTCAKGMSSAPPVGLGARIGQLKLGRKGSQKVQLGGGDGDGSYVSSGQRKRSLLS